MSHSHIAYSFIDSLKYITLFDLQRSVKLKVYNVYRISYNW